MVGLIANLAQSRITWSEGFNEGLTQIRIILTMLVDVERPAHCLLMVLFPRKGSWTVYD